MKTKNVFPFLSLKNVLLVKLLNAQFLFLENLLRVLKKKCNCTLALLQREKEGEKLLWWILR
jgi:hypothetical protein